MAKWNRGRRQRERRKFSEDREEASVQTITLTQTFASPEDLVALGPFVQAGWSVPQATAEAAQARGETVPSPLKGAIFLDTGAEFSLIHPGVVERLGLESAGNLVSPEEDDAPPPVVLADLTLFVQQATQVSEVRFTRRVWVESALCASTPPGGGLEEGLLGVLGRDVLRHCLLTCDGPRGYIQLDILHRSLLQASEGGTTL